jgi:hypothetical protein
MHPGQIFDSWLKGTPVGKFVFHAHLTLNLYVKVGPKMDQRMIAASLVLMGLSARAIYEELIATLGSDAVL